MINKDLCLRNTAGVKYSDALILNLQVEFFCQESILRNFAIIGTTIKWKNSVKYPNIL